MTPEDKAREERKEAFERWRTDPVTKDVMAVLTLKAEEARETWMRRSWNQGKCDEVERADLAASAASWLYVTDLDAEEIEDIIYAESKRD